MKTPFLFIIFISFPTGIESEEMYCHEVLGQCQGNKDVPWTRCYDVNIGRCIVKGRQQTMANFYRQTVNSSNAAIEKTIYGHTVHITAKALKKSMDSNSTGYVSMTVSVLNSSLFRPVSAPGHELVGILGSSVLGVRVGDQPVHDLDQPVTLTFRRSQVTGNGICVFWKELDDNDSSGKWSPDGCKTSTERGVFVCLCNHLSFFAVLVNPDVSVDPANALRLNYISYIGSIFSVIFTIIILIMYLCLRNGHTDHTVRLHIQLTVALLFLHLSFLFSVCWALFGSEGHACEALGLLLHYSLLATFTWMAIEGFHLYLLLVRVFNIYVRRYLLKLSLIGWGLPMAIVMLCALAGVYGRQSLQIEEANNSSATEICWISNKSNGLVSHITVTHVTVTGYLAVVLLGNATMIVVVVVKLFSLRGKGRQYEETKTTIWKDILTVLGLSCILGVPWGLAFGTYGPLTLPGLYFFSILNCFQGVFMFLWFLSLTCKTRPQELSSTKVTSQKTETSFQT